jgi:Zn-dependent peptidase ImmA (M78 family)
MMPETGDVDEFVQAVARYRGRRIVTLAQELGLEAPTGYWISTTDTEYVVYPEDSNDDQRAVIICHELAHMLLNHQPPEGSVDLGELAPSIAPSIAARFLNRHGFDDAMEADAERLATQLTSELDRRALSHELARDNISARLR